MATLLCMCRLLLLLYLTKSEQKSLGSSYFQNMRSGGFLANPNETEWIPVELELVDRIWLPDTEILRLKGFHSLSVLDRLQVSLGMKWLSHSWKTSRVEVLYENVRKNNESLLLTDAKGRQNPRRIKLSTFGLCGSSGHFKVCT